MSLAADTAKKPTEVCHLLRKVKKEQKKCNFFFTQEKNYDIVTGREKRMKLPIRFVSGDSPEIREFYPPDTQGRSA